MMTQVHKGLATESLSEKSCCATDIDRLFSTELFRALADANRIALLGHLAIGGSPQTVTEAAGCCPMEAEKRGREVYYSVRYAELSRVLREMADAIDACCPPAKAEKQPKEVER
jgi:hypothetical protein